MKSYEKVVGGLVENESGFRVPREPTVYPQGIEKLEVTATKTKKRGGVVIGKKRLVEQDDFSSVTKVCGVRVSKI